MINVKSRPEALEFRARDSGPFVSEHERLATAPANSCGGTPGSRPRGCEGGFVQVLFVQARSSDAGVPLLHGSKRKHQRR